MTDRCNKLRNKVSEVTGYSIKFSGPTFNEFAVRLPKNADHVVSEMAERGFLAGLPLQTAGRGGENDLLIAVTEKRTREELDAYARTLTDICS